MQIKSSISKIPEETGLRPATLRRLVWACDALRCFLLKEPQDKNRYFGYIPTFITFFGLCILVASCENDRLPEQSFELPKGDYPRLVDVPERPTYPSEQVIGDVQKQLEAASTAADQTAKVQAP
ncbi:hypothetical protein [Candidatus Paracaedibacter symbiosus]|uniref:hypothetical protein n=1 Tax=Candidatus Paracaedibacter symbiosus TaxID=244582 RepID=UPI0005095420|nr:hypothetical protein [Candidatus Paracaedibacter symbiosus]